MSLKNMDSHNRWRNKTVAFRVSPEEDEQIEIAVKLTGLTKQDYIIRRLLCKDVIVQGNPRVFKALRDQLAAVLEQLQRIEAGNSVDDELLDTFFRNLPVRRSAKSRQVVLHGAACLSCQHGTEALEL